MKNVLALVILTLLLLPGSTLLGFELHRNSHVEFACCSDAQKILKSRDLYIKALSPFDKRLRIQTNRDIDDEEFLDFISSQSQEWTVREKEKIQKALVRIRHKILPYNIYLPRKIFFLKTTGKEEGDAPYTRNGNSVVLPVREFSQSHQQLFETISHELFHIISRNNPKLRSQLYEMIGFKKCDPITLPLKWQNRKITNPDAPENAHYIEVIVKGKMTPVVPFLLSSDSRYDEKRGRTFFNHVQLKFIPIERKKGKCMASKSEEALLSFDINEISGFFEQVGMNTPYIIHPEEILADNFTLLLAGKQNVLSPDLLLEFDHRT